MKALLVNGGPVRYDLIPVPYMRDGMRLYLEHGIEPGSFMTALLCNDFMEMCARADDTNRRHLFEWASWLYNHAPSGSFGSPERFEAWLNAAHKESSTVECKRCGGYHPTSECQEPRARKERA